MAGKEKKSRKTGLRDERGRFIKQDTSTLPGKRFTTTDERAREAGRRSGIARKEKGDLRRLCKLWMEEEVGTGKDGEKITGGEMMVRVAVKEVAKGNPRFWELLRDTAGYKPVDKVMVAEVDPDVVNEVEQMVKECAE